jgi:hypothetical protein
MQAPGHKRVLTVVHWTIYGLCYSEFSLVTPSSSLRDNALYRIALAHPKLIEFLPDETKIVALGFLSWLQQFRWRSELVEWDRIHVE